MEKVHGRKPRMLALAASLAAPLLAAPAQAAPQGEALVNSKCITCHAPAEDGQLARIGDSRRTPEGWDMTVARMIISHGVKLSADERAAVVKYLADTRGLAPQETDGYRYLIERDFNRVESVQGEAKPAFDTCARCHSYGRIALQRRTESDWAKLPHYHVGQYPVIEIQAGGRDRNWWELATTQVPAILGKLYPNDSGAWQQWQQRERASAAGTWRFVGHRPGRGAYEGVATIEADRAGADRYKVKFQFDYADGQRETAEGEAIIYTGYEWRASVKQDGMDVRQVFTLSPDGQTLSGRWYENGIDAIGGRLLAARSGKGSAERLLAVEPTHIKAGTTQRVTLYGNNLSGDVSLGDSITVARVVERAAGKVVVEAQADGTGKDGVRAAAVGNARLQQGLALYRNVDYVAVEPEQAMAVVGGGKGPLPKVPVQFESVGYTFGPDGKQGTADDIRLGYFPATWSMANANAFAEEMQDTAYAGTLRADGLFIPGDAGPNPKRRFGTNNAGELAVTATVDDAGRQLSASKHLIVTLQRWNDPPLR
ncbi:quinohemoprotein amine dehydrogenase subunit alpha [Thauera sp. 63]|uniref:quinohemoprotein amine dehydrogenase subunit alpha n=1 Tax=Thauera sp. 63 TaxID=497321 RepID=UPI000570347D|nr:quinohemoprotein amine dehydrogenase subunit alpha [Thauera sp. 63]